MPSRGEAAWGEAVYSLTRRSQQPAEPETAPVRQAIVRACMQSLYAKMPASALLQVEPVLKSFKGLLNLGNRGQKVLLIAYKGGLSKKCMLKRALVQKMLLSHWGHQAMGATDPSMFKIICR